MERDTETSDDHADQLWKCKMIVDERFLTYLRSLEGQEIDYIAAIEKEALETYVPIIRKDTQTFMKFLMQTLRPEQILEVGTAVGFSALLMEAYDPADCQITTIENYPPRIPIARANFARAKKEACIPSDRGGCAGGSADPDRFL